MIVGWITSKLGGLAGGWLLKGLPYAIVAALIAVIWWQNQTINEYEGVKQANEKLAEQQALDATRLQELADERAAASKTITELREKLRKHDLANLARAKPGLVERRVNRGTADALRMFECITDPALPCPDRASPGSD